MKHKIYTTYLSNLKNIDTSNGIVAVIMRFTPFIPEESNMIHVPELSPSGELLSSFKDNKDFKKFEEELWKEFDNDSFRERIDQITEALDNYNDVYLVCCEKDYINCHRSILGKHFKFLGYEWIEIQEKGEINAKV